MTMRRRFNDRERFALFLASDGKCSLCGTPLSAGFHADHIVPYSKEGLTDVTNGQALCAACNLKKGATMTHKIEGLRHWQADSFDDYQRKVLQGQRSYFTVACPAAGKTQSTMYQARWLLDEDFIDQIIVVVPNRTVKRSWKHTAWKKYGIALAQDYGNGTFSAMSARMVDGTLGVIATYSQVVRGVGPDIFRRLTTSARTLVVFDEAHHMGESRSWGDECRRAFDQASFYTLLSGTPIRTDGHLIPFVRYQQKSDNIMECIADTNYSYGVAVNDDPSPVRRVVFTPYAGEVEWRIDGKEYRAVISPDTGERDMSSAMKAALDPRHDFLRQVIQDADEELLEIRAGIFPDAAGMIVARDYSHAQQVAELLRDVTGKRPLVVTSRGEEDDDEDAAKAIEGFASNPKTSPRWLVSIKMVSEGTDIPRLCVGVYATNITTHTYFTQWVGRFLRQIEGYEQLVARLFVVAHPEIVKHADSITKSVMESIINEVADADDGETRDESDSGDTSDPPPVFEVLNAESERLDDRYDGGEWSLEEQRAAREWATIGGLSYAALLPVVRHVLAKMNNGGQVGLPFSDGPAENAEHPEDAVRDRVSTLTKKKTGLISKYMSSLMRHKCIEFDEYNEVVAKATKRLNDLTDRHPIPGSTIMYLDRRIEIVDQWIRDVHMGEVMPHAS